MTSTASISRCEFCGRFMSHDDILLGYGRQVIGIYEIVDEVFSHYECVQRYKAVMKLHEKEAIQKDEENT